MPELPDDPREQARQLIAAARLQFARDVDRVLEEFEGRSTVTGLGDGAWRELRRFIVEKFDERLSFRPTADPVLVQLVREAFELLNDDDTRLDRKDWSREAKKWLMEG